MIEITDKKTGDVRIYTSAEFEATKSALLTAWDEARKVLSEAKDREMALRIEYVDFAFDQNKDKGTERIEIGNGWEAKAVKKINYGWVKNGEKVDKAAIDNALDEIERTVENGVLISERLVKWTPELSQTEYKLLDEKAKRIIDAVIVTSTGAPTLEIIPPKAKKV